MNDLIHLVDNRINKQLRESTTLRSIPCRILEIYQNGNVRIRVVQNKSEYVVPNYSGSDLIVGEEAQLFCQGDISSGRFMYIGASNNKSTKGGNAFNVISGIIMTGEVFTEDREISRINLTSNEQSESLLVFNATAFGSNHGNLTIKIYINEIEYNFISITTLSANEYRTISFSLPVTLNPGIYKITIKACGSGNLSAINSYIAGHDIDEYEYYEETNENDFIFKIDNDKCSIIYYTGKSSCPKIPTEIQGVPVTKLYETAFNYSNITNVYIPDGVKEII